MNAPQFVSVYAGQTCIGHVLARSKRGFEAFDTEDNSIGIFASQLAAADVLTKRFRNEKGHRDLPSH